MHHGVLAASGSSGGINNVIGGIDADNAASIALHERFGFERCGVVRHAGFKFGRWLDLVLYQKLLETPVDPVEG